MKEDRGQGPSQPGQFGRLFREAFEMPEEKRQRQRDAEVASLSKRVTNLEEDCEDPEYRFVIGFR